MDRKMQMQIVAQSCCRGSECDSSGAGARKQVKWMRRVRVAATDHFRTHCAEFPRRRVKERDGQQMMRRVSLALRLGVGLVDAEGARLAGAVPLGPVSEAHKQSGCRSAIGRAS